MILLILLIEYPKTYSFVNLLDVAFVETLIIFIIQNKKIIIKFVKMKKKHYNLSFFSGMYLGLNNNILIISSLL